MLSANDLRRMAGKLRTLATDQDEKIRLGLTEAAAKYESEAEALELVAANATVVMVRYARN